MTTIANVLGQAREVNRFYGDGSFDCPFCTYPVIVPALECSNPWCTANPSMLPVEAQKIIDQIAQRKAEEDRRQHDHNMAMARIAKDKEDRHEARQLAIAEAKSRGCCLSCPFDRYDRVKYIKHRGECPNKAKGHR